MRILSTDQITVVLTSHNWKDPIKFNNRCKEIIK